MAENCRFPIWREEVRLAERSVEPVGVLCLDDDPSLPRGSGAGMELSRSFEPGVSPAVGASRETLNGGAQKFLAEQYDERLKLGRRLILVRVLHGSPEVGLTGVSPLDCTEILESSVLRLADVLGCPHRVPIRACQRRTPDAVGSKRRQPNRGGSNGTAVPQSDSVSRSLSDLVSGGRPGISVCRRMYSASEGRSGSHGHSPLRGSSDSTPSLRPSSLLMEFRRTPQRSCARNQPG